MVTVAGIGILTHPNSHSMKTVKIAFSTSTTTLRTHTSNPIFWYLNMATQKVCWMLLCLSCNQIFLVSMLLISCQIYITSTLLNINLSFCEWVRNDYSYRQNWCCNWCISAKFKWFHNTFNLQRIIIPDTHTHTKHRNKMKNYTAFSDSAQLFIQIEKHDWKVVFCIIQICFIFLRKKVIYCWRIV